MTDPAHSAGGPHVEPASRKRPRLAVLMPVFNDQPGMEKALRSLAQDGAPFDVFVVDDGSEPPIIKPPDLPYHLHVVRLEPNQGITAALNAGLAMIEKRKYQYVARLDAGDLSLPGRFAAQLAFLDSHPEHAAVGTATRHADMHGNVRFDFYPPQEHAALVRFYRYRSGIVHPSAMIRMQALLDCGFYHDRFPGGEDYDLFMRLAKKYKLGNLNSILVKKEINPDSITSKRLPIVISRIKLLAWYFDPKTVHSYLGLMFNTLHLLIPRPLALKLRRLGSQWREQIARVRIRTRGIPWSAAALMINL